MLFLLCSSDGCERHVSSTLSEEHLIEKIREDAIKNPQKYGINHETAFKEIADNTKATKESLERSADMSKYLTSESLVNELNKNDSELYKTVKGLCPSDFNPTEVAALKKYLADNKDEKYPYLSLAANAISDYSLYIILAPGFTTDEKKSYYDKICKAIFNSKSITTYEAKINNLRSCFGNSLNDLRGMPKSLSIADLTAEKIEQSTWFLHPNGKDVLYVLNPIILGSNLNVLNDDPDLIDASNAANNHTGAEILVGP